jgi:TnpA family transposase
MRRAERSLLKEGVSLIDRISSFSPSDVGKLQDEDVLRYVAKYSRNKGSRRKAISELIRLDAAHLLEYLAMTCEFDDTRKSAIRGLARLSETDSLKIIVRSQNPKAVREACSGLFRNIDTLIRKGDVQGLELIEKHSPANKQRKTALNWIEKMRVMKMIKKMESG